MVTGAIEISAETDRLVCIQLNDGVDFEAFKASAEEQFGAFVYRLNPLTTQMTDMIYGMVKTPMDILVIIFLSFSALVVLSLLFLSYMDGIRSFGTLKTLGLTTEHITAKNLCKMLILSAAGFALGLVAGVLIAPHIFALTTMTVAAAFRHSLSMTLLIVGALVSVVTLITLLFAIPIGRVKPKILMEE
jgi:ABC-type antimicrobial peptide transport system permease subunit